MEPQYPPRDTPSATGRNAGSQRKNCIPQVVKTTLACTRVIAQGVRPKSGATARWSAMHWIGMLPLCGRAIWNFVIEHKELGGPEAHHSLSLVRHEHPTKQRGDDDHTSLNSLRSQRRAKRHVSCRPRRGEPNSSFRLHPNGVGAPLLCLAGGVQPLVKTLAGIPCGCGGSDGCSHPFDFTFDCIYAVTARP